MILTKETNTQILFESFSSHGLAGKPVLITDSFLKDLLGEKIPKNIPVLDFVLDEPNKTRSSKEKIEDALFNLGNSRDTHLLAFGGGVVSDIVGFVAATFCRGVSWSVIPTTLLSMVDACLGGKTGVNTAFGKNTVGAFHPPDIVFIDFSYLETLPQIEWLSGYAEVIKYGLIASSMLFENMEKGFSLERDVPACLSLKQEITQEDFFDQGRRAILNFGHTIAHGIEKLSNYTIPHGLAVARGLIAESFLSMHLGGLSPQEFERITNLIDRLGFPKYSCDPSLLKAAMRHDKKSLLGQLHCTVLSSIGKVAAFSRAIPETLLDEALKLI